MMRINRITSTAVLAIAATGITAGAAYAAPAQPAAPAPAEQQVAPSEVKGSDHGVGYRTALSPDRSAVVTTIDAGMFKLSADENTIAILDKAGKTISTLPAKGVVVQGQQVNFVPVIEAGGKVLNLKPVGKHANMLKDTGRGQDWFMAELNKAAPGIIAGAIIGFFVGFIPIVGWILLGPPGAAVVGALIGAYVVGGQPLIDSGIAFLNGR